MSIYGNPKENKVCVNWLSKNEKCVKYFRNEKGKRLSFIGSEDSLKDANKTKEFRESRYKKIMKVVKVGKDYLLYSN